MKPSISSIQGMSASRTSVLPSFRQTTPERGTPQTPPSESRLNMVRHHSTCSGSRLIACRLVELISDRLLELRGSSEEASVRDVEHAVACALPLAEPDVAVECLARCPKHAPVRRDGHDPLRRDAERLGDLGEVVTLAPLELGPAHVSPLACLSSRSAMRLSLRPSARFALRVFSTLRLRSRSCCRA